MITIIYRAAHHGLERLFPDFVGYIYQYQLLYHDQLHNYFFDLIELTPLTATISELFSPVLQNI